MTSTCALFGRSGRTLLGVLLLGFSGLLPLAAGEAPASTATPVATPAATPAETPATTPVPPAGPEIVRARLDSIIHPVAEQFVVEAIAEAEASGAVAFVLELNTPGGALDSTRRIFTAMLGTPIPVVVWVAPSGSQAASAGFFLLMAGDIAVMAPGTNTGAAHPVGGQGETIEGVMGKKVEQDAAATIRSLAGRRGRDQALAEKAVVESRSFSAAEALAAGLVDFSAASWPELLAGLEGREVVKGAQGKRVLHLAGASVRRVEMSAQQRLLSTLAHPNLAYILLSLGFLGLYFELAHPGAVLPGVVGGISLILAFFGLSVLPVNYAGVALILLGLVLFVAEIKVTSYGLLTVGGIISLVLGSLLLFRSAEPALRVSLGLIAAITLFALGVVSFLAWVALRAARRPVRSGPEGMVGTRVTVTSALAPRGKVKLDGDYWNAELEGSIAEPVVAGSEVEVVSVDGLTLRVRPATPARR